jgi:TatD DNase family protein
MQLIDTHCHLDLPAFDADREDVLKRAREAGVSELVIPSVRSSGWDRLVSYCSADKGLHYALGLHPVFLEQHDGKDLLLLEEKLSASDPVAIGETGLDYYVPGLDRTRQEYLFISQLELASTAGLPVILHVRKAHDQVLALLRQYPVVGGIAHAFNGSMQQAGKYIDLGFKLGFGGMLTYERSRHLRTLARDLPLGALVLETDAPDMAVAKHHGERNSPEYLPDCLLALAEARGQDAKDVAETTFANALEAFRILR